jgi:outer membrane protein assembly factor BamB
VFAVTDDGYMYYLSATGELIWKSDFDRHTDSSPVISGGLAYLGTNNDELLIINLNPDMSSSGGSTKLPPWVVQQASFLTAGAVHSSPAFSGEAVFVGGGEFVYSLNPNAGGGGGETTTTANGGSTTTTANGGSNTTTTAPSVIKWQYSINGDIYSSPAVSGGKVYVGADNGYLYALSENVSENTDTSNVINEGKLLWQRKTGGKIRSSPAVVAPASTAVSTSATAVNMVYVGSDDGALYAFDENGQFKWKFPTSAPISSSPAVDKNGDIYFGSENGSVYALFPDGALKWVYRTRGPVRSSPAIGPDKKIYIGSDDGYLYCIGESDEPNREPDYNIVDTASPDTIENGGNPTIVTAAVTSQSDDPNILSSIASVTLDLTPLLLIDFDTGELVTKVVMLDDGNGQDDFAGDGIFTFAFGITTDLNDPGILLPQDGIYTYLLSLALAEFPVPAVGPVPLMVTVTDIYGHRVSKPFALNIAKKMEGSFTDLYDDQIINGLSNQTLDVSISITSGIVQSITINPNTGTAGSIVQVLITGQNTNFETNKTAVLICNDNNAVIASAPPQVPDVQVVNSTALTAQLSIKDNTVVNSTGIWDVKVITDLGDCPEFNTNLASFCTALPTDLTFTNCEIVVAKDAFTISTAAQAAALQQLASPDQKDFIIGAQEQCQLEFSMLNPAGAFAKDTPFNFASGYPREFAVPLAANGTWTVNLSSGTCVEGQSFKISTTGSNFGLLTGQVTNGITGERIDDVTIAAIIGDLSNIPLDLTKTSNSTKSSGGGYYMLPLAATRDKYTVFATKDGLIDIRNYVVIEDKKESTLNFSLKLDLSCPVTTALKEGNLNNFYAFRDKILLKNPQGKRWVVLYYRHSAEVTDIILKHPDFRKKAAAFIMKAALESRKMLKGEKADSRMRAKLEELINSLIKVGSPELRNSLLTEKKAILGFIEPSAK